MLFALNLHKYVPYLHAIPHVTYTCYIIERVNIKQKHYLAKYGRKNHLFTSSLLYSMGIFIERHDDQRIEAFSKSREFTT